MLCINVIILEQFLQAINPNITQREIKTRIASDFPRWFQTYVSVENSKFTCINSICFCTIVTIFVFLLSFI